MKKILLLICVIIAGNSFAGYNQLMKSFGPQSIAGKRAKELEHKYKYNTLSISPSYIKQIKNEQGMVCTTKIIPSWIIEVKVYNPFWSKATGKKFHPVLNKVLLEIATTLNFTNSEKIKVKNIINKMPAFRYNKIGNSVSFASLFLIAGIKDSSKLFEQYRKDKYSLSYGMEPCIGFKLSEKNYLTIFLFDEGEPKKEFGKYMVFSLGSDRNGPEPLVECKKNGKWISWPYIEVQ